MPTDADRRIVFVHAHPDDETIHNGVTMARYVAEGAQVSLVTCTRGELGEVIPPDLAHLAANRDDALGDHRAGELVAAMAALGVTDHRFLDEQGAADGEGSGVGSGRYRDSGMVWGSDGLAAAVPEPGPGAFALTEVDEVAAGLAVVLRELRPQVVVGYEPGGGYGHPDHVHAHRVTMRAVDLAARVGPGGAPWSVAKVYWTVFPADEAAAAQITTVIDGAAYRAAKVAALRAHASQIVVDEPFFALSNGVRQPVTDHEFYRLVGGVPGGHKDAQGRETDLFG